VRCPASERADASFLSLEGSEDPKFGTREALRLSSGRLMLMLF